MGKHKVRASELRKLSKEEKLRLLEEWRRELITLRYKGATGNPGRLRELRRNIARLLTILREEELGIRREGGS